MSLPVIPKKFFDVKSKYLPKGKITMSPFTVGLENLLLQVKESEDDKEKMSAVKQVVQECTQTPDLDVGALPLFVVEEVFLRLREHSIGELIEQQYQCSNEKPDETICNTVMPIQIDLREFKLVEQPEHTNVIVVADPIGVKFRYPSIDMFEDEGTDTSDEVETIISCIESIFDADNVHKAEDQTRAELTNFWKSLTLRQKKEVFDKFFNTMPHMHYKKDHKCPGCGHVHTIEFNSLQEVFS
jgi:hypothetical protein